MGSYWTNEAAFQRYIEQNLDGIFDMFLHDEVQRYEREKRLPEGGLVDFYAIGKTGLAYILEVKNITPTNIKLGKDYRAAIPQLLMYSVFAKNYNILCDALVLILNDSPPLWYWQVIDQYQLPIYTVTLGKRECDRLDKRDILEKQPTV